MSDFLDEESFRKRFFGNERSSDIPSAPSDKEVREAVDSLRTKGHISDDFSAYKELVERENPLKEVKFRRGGLLGILSTVGLTEQEAKYAINKMVLPELGVGFLGSEMPLLAYSLARLDLPHQTIMEIEDFKGAKYFQDTSELNVLRYLTGANLDKRGEIREWLRHCVRKNPVQLMAIVENGKKIPLVRRVIKQLTQ